jgi:hypothetical protein
LILVFIHIIFIISILLIISKKQTILPTPYFWCFATSKIIIGITIGYLFVELREGSDTLFLFNQGQMVANQLNDGLGTYLEFIFQSQFPSFKSESRNLFFGKILSVPIIFTQGNFWLTNIYLSLLNFLAGLLLFKKLLEKYSDLKVQLLVSVFLLPSVQIWTSGILKESILVSFIYLIIVSLLYLSSSKMKLIPVSLIIVYCFFIFNIKYYVLPPLLFGLIILFLGVIKRRINLTRYMEFGLSVMGILATMLLSSLLHHHLDLSIIPQSLHDNHQTIIYNSFSKNTFILSFDPTWESIVVYSPLSLITGLFRPLLSEGSIFNILYWIESMVAICFTCYSFCYWKRWRFSYVILAALAFILTLALFLPFATGNFGTLARYRVIYWPLFLFMISIIPLNDFVSFRQRIG